MATRDGAPMNWYPCACGAEHDTPTCPFGVPAAPGAPLDPEGFPTIQDSPQAIAAAALASTLTWESEQ